MHKVLVIVPFALDESGMANRKAQLLDVRLGPDIAFDFRGVQWGPALYDGYHDWALADLALFQAGRTAQDEGYAAVCIDTMSDSGVNALRSVLDIPVIGPGRASYATALMLGDRFSVLTQWAVDRDLQEGPQGVRTRGQVRVDPLDEHAARRLEPARWQGGGGVPEAPGRRGAVHRGWRRGDLHGLDHDAPGRAVPARAPARAGHQPRAAHLQARRVLHRPRPDAEPQGLSKPHVEQFSALDAMLAAAAGQA